MKINPVVLSVVSAAVFLFGPAAASTSAQSAVPSPALTYQPLSDQQLDQLLAPIALYPDPLLAQLLPATTLPTEIVLADRYVVGGGDPNLIVEQGWDPSVQALARYPAVLQYLDKYLAWTTQIGQAFVNQQPQVMESVQRLRWSAQNYGNLVSTPQEEVVDDGGDIEIEPVDPTVIYVPVYDPAIIYYESGCLWTFGVGCTLGACAGWRFRLASPPHLFLGAEPTAADQLVASTAAPAASLDGPARHRLATGASWKSRWRQWGGSRLEPANDDRAAGGTSGWLWRRHPARASGNQSAPAGYATSRHWAGAPGI